MKYACNYSIVRFLPYPETGEFVNIGVVLLSDSGAFHYRLEETKFQRVTQFFHTLDRPIYTRARDGLIKELERVTVFMQECSGGIEMQIATFKHLTHARETMIRFSDPGTMMTNDPKKAVDTLFEHYVNLSFATKEYEEKRLERQMGQLLLNSNLKQRYKPRKLGTDQYEVRFPFVMIEEDRAVQAIKPIFLGQEQSSKIIEHGDAWISKIGRLKRSQRLASDTLFITAAPKGRGATLAKAYDEIVKELGGIKGVRVINRDSPRDKLIAAIKEGAPEIH